MSCDSADVGVHYQICSSSGFFSLCSVRDGLVLHDHVAKHVLVLAASTTAHTVLVNIYVLAFASLDVIAYGIHGFEDLVAHLVLGQLVVLQLEVSLSLGESGVSGGGLKINLLLLLLHLGVVDSLVHLQGLLLLSRAVLQSVSLLLSLYLDVTLLLRNHLFLLSELVLVVLLHFSLLDDEVGLALEAVSLDAVLLAELSLHLREELGRADGHVRDLDSLHPHTPAGKQLLHVVLDTVTEHRAVLQDLIDSHVGDLVTDERAGHGADLLSDLGGVGLEEAGAESLVQLQWAITFTVGTPDDHARDSNTLHLKRYLVSREGALSDLSGKLHELVAREAPRRQADTLLDELSVTQKQAILIGVTLDPVLAGAKVDVVASITKSGKWHEELHPGNQVDEPRDRGCQELDEVSTSDDTEVATLRGGNLAQVLSFTSILRATRGRRIVQGSVVNASDEVDTLLRSVAE